VVPMVPNNVSNRSHRIVVSIVYYLFSILGY